MTDVGAGSRENGTMEGQVTAVKALELFVPGAFLADDAALRELKRYVAEEFGAHLVLHPAVWPEALLDLRLQGRWSLPLSQVQSMIASRVDAAFIDPDGVDALLEA